MSLVPRIGSSFVTVALFALVVASAPLGCAAETDELVPRTPVRATTRNATVHNTDNGSYKPAVADRSRHGLGERTKAGKLGR